MKIYHIIIATLISLLAVQDRVSAAPIPIVYDTESMMAHRLTGAQEIQLPAGAALPFAGFDIEVNVTPEGEVSAARPARNAVLEGANAAPALAVARSWRFRPFLYHGRAVAVRGQIRVEASGAGEWRDPEAALPPIDYSSLRIRLVRSACFGECPDYAVTIDGQGDVVFTTRDDSLPGTAEVHRSFNPREGILLPGVHRARIERAAIDALIERFRAAHFFGLKPRYVGGVTDSSSYELSFETGGRRFAVLDYVGGIAGMPPVVTALENAVDEAAGTSRWIAGDERTIPYLRSVGFDFTSPEAMRLALAASAWNVAPDRLTADLIQAGVPLDRPFAIDGNPAPPLGETLLLNAVRWHRTPLVVLLAERGWLARTPRARLSQAFAEGAGGCDARTARLLVEAGADPMARTAAPAGDIYAGGATALHVAVRPYSVCGPTTEASLVRALIALGVQVDATDDAGQTALYHVEDPDLQELLLGAGARADIHDKRGNSPVFGSWTDRIVLGLLDAGADPHGRDEEGHELRRAARERDMPSVLAWLDAHGVR